MAKGHVYSRTQGSWPIVYDLPKDGFITMKQCSRPRTWNS